MKHAALCLLVLAHATGCIIASDDDDDSARITVTWTLQSLATQTAQPCPVGFDTAAVYSQPIDDTDMPIGDATIDLFNCSDGAGVTSQLSSTTYAESVAIATDDNSVQYGTSVPVFVGITATELEADVPPIYTDAGHFELQWQLTAASTGANLMCSDDPDVFSIEVTVDDCAGHVTAEPPFGCADPVGYTAGILDGSYTIIVAATDANGTQLGISDPIEGSIATTATTGNTITDLHVVTIPIGNK
jgi:hypothetical protein